MKKDSQPHESSRRSAVPGRIDLRPGKTSLLEHLQRKLGHSYKLHGVYSSNAALVLSACWQMQRGVYLWICQNNRQVEETADNLAFFLPREERGRILLIPGVEADPYRGLSPHPEIAERRALGLWRILRSETGFVVTTLSSLLARLLTPKTYLSHCQVLEIGTYIPRDHLVRILRELGYVREDPVSDVGEFSFRGGIIDIFSPAHEFPVRVEFFGDEVESIREFDPSNQRSVNLVPSCEIVPMRELIVTETDLSRWHERAPDFWTEVRFAESLEEKRQFTEHGEPFNGFEFLLPLVLDNSASLLDYIPSSAALSIVLPEPGELDRMLAGLEEALQAGYEDCHLGGDLALPPERLTFDRRWLVQQLGNFSVLELSRLGDDESAEVFDFRPERKYQGRLQDALADLSTWKDSGERAVFVTPSQGMAERIVEIFHDYDVHVAAAAGGFWEAAEGPVSVGQGRISEGFHSPELKLHVVTEDELFGERHKVPVPRKVSHGETVERFLSDFRDLKEGDFVVHVDHGIGLFSGLKSIGVGDGTREFVVLKYASDDKLYVPIDRLDLLQKFSSSGDARPRVDRLGGTSWEKTKRKIRRSVRDLAEELLKLYARRGLVAGHAFSPDDHLMKEFEQAFEYEETVDQLAAIRDTKRDMESPHPMDRLICGDVGYGKTEVAMRAAFKAVLGGKQVAVLAPTTVLAFQHLTTFAGRFKGFPVEIAMLSRFLKRNEQKETVKRVAEGKVDVLIGTHRILSNDIVFSDLGLIVVDEEQRFGVAQKEKLKKLKTEVDVLTLSATPIPRTLNMSLTGIRDLSIIESPPKDRLAIQTVVVKFSRNIIRSAIDLELKRGGQIFLVHNSIDSIYSMAQMIQEIVPEARIAVAHGQMREVQLEQVMLDFLNYGYDVLVCTTIIENGLDIRRANTLVVNQADRFGLSQLYQLRGRVGRSNRRAYAYFLIPSDETLPSDARKRLAAIREFSDLGTGFRIAALDMEIRGAGSILGGAQHGHINAVGFELYLKLLEDTMRELRGEEVREKARCTLDLNVDIQVPVHYISDSNLRLWLYKRISTTADYSRLVSLREEVVDRFGKYPRSVANLFESARLRLKAEDCRIELMERKGGRLLLKFRDNRPLNPDRIIDLVQQREDFQLTPQGGLAVTLQSDSAWDIFDLVDRTLTELSEDRP